MKRSEFERLNIGETVKINHRRARMVSVPVESCLGRGLVAKFEYSDTRRQVWKSFRQVKEILGNIDSLKKGGKNDTGTEIIGGR